jgi:hypothetical protein
MFPVLKILEVLLHRLEGVAARTDDPDNYLRHAATGPHAAYTLPQPTKEDLKEILKAQADQYERVAQIRQYARIDVEFVERVTR